MFDGIAGNFWGATTQPQNLQTLSPSKIPAGIYSALMTIRGLTGGLFCHSIRICPPPSIEDFPQLMSLAIFELDIFWRCPRSHSEDQVLLRASGNVGKVVRKEPSLLFFMHTCIFWLGRWVCRNRFLVCSRLARWSLATNCTCFFVAGLVARTSN